MTTALHTLRKALAAKKIDGMVITKPENTYYLTNIVQTHPNQREAMLFVSKNGALVFHSSLLQVKLSQRYQTLTFNQQTKLPEVLAALYPSTATIAFESNNLTVNEFEFLKKHLSPHMLEPTQDYIENLRIHKTDLEIKHISQSGASTASIMEWSIALVKKNRTHSLSEKAVALAIKKELLERGLDTLAFPVHVAFDENTSLPHHTPSTKKLTPDSIVMLDLGCKVGNYCADMTRTFLLGNPSKEMRQVESVILAAYEAALEAAKVGNPASAVDDAARTLIADAGYGENFITSTGHGLGLEIHEQPSLSPKNETLLEKNMTVTIEPGIYLPGKFGYRHENTIHLTPAGPKNLTQSLV